MSFLLASRASFVFAHVAALAVLCLAVPRAAAQSAVDDLFTAPDGETPAEAVDRLRRAYDHLQYALRGDDGQIDWAELRERSAALLDDVDFEDFDATQLSELCNTLIVQHSHAACDRMVHRLDDLARVDAPAGATAALVRCQVLHLRKSMIADEVPLMDRRRAAARAALLHPYLAEGLELTERPAVAFEAIYERTAGVDDVLLEVAPELPLDLPPSVARVLPELQRRLVTTSIDEHPEPVEAARRRFVLITAHALNAMAGDDPHVRQSRALNPHLRDRPMSAPMIESSRRSSMERLNEALAALTSPRARGTMIGGMFPRLDLVHATRPVGDVRTPLASTVDLRGQPILAMHVPMSSLVDRRGDGRQTDSIRDLLELRDRYEAIGMEVFLAISPMHHPTHVWGGYNVEPPADNVAALDEAIERLGLDCPIALVPRTELDGGPLDRFFTPCMLDRDLRVIAADLRFRDVEDGLEQLNPILQEHGLISEDRGDVPATRRTAWVGQPAPELTFAWTSDDLDASRLSDLRGKVVVLDFWATWCGPCIAAFPKMRELRERFGEEDVVIIGVTSVQGFHITKDRERIELKDEPAREFALMTEAMEEHGITWSVAFTEQNVFNPDYGVRGIPSVFVIDRDGVLRSPGMHPAGAHQRLTSLVEGLVATPASAPGDGRGE